MIFVFPVSLGIRFVMNFVVLVFFFGIRFFGPKPKRGEKKPNRSSEKLILFILKRLEILDCC